MDGFLKRAWVEIHLDRLAHNLSQLKSLTAGSTEIACVVKANAYGHDDRHVVPFLETQGIRFFAVSNIMEAKQLRDAGCKGDILILGYTPPEYAPELSEQDIIQTAVSLDHAQALSGCAEKPVRVHIALDTGMGRIGVLTDDLDTCISEIEQITKLKNIKSEGIFTHFASADSYLEDDIKYTRKQLDRFFEIREVLEKKGISFKHYHCLNSAGGTFYTTYSEKKNTLVRFGIMLYGLYPDVSLELPVKLKPVMDFKSAVSYIKTLKKGQSVSYGRTFTAHKDMTVATIPVGYADGYSRQLSNIGEVLVNGYRAKILGRICMDQTMIDITGIKGVSVGTEVTLIGTDGRETITADDLAQLYGTIGYEIICGINKRVPRIIMNDGKIVHIAEY
jgi:alanine racemase